MAERESLAGFGTVDIWGRAVRLLVEALGRRWVSVALIVVLFLSVGAAAASWLPRTYSTQTRLLIKKNYVMPALAHPRRAVPIGSEAPAQSAAELVLSHDSLADIIRANDLVTRWDEERQPLARLKDTVMSWVRGPVSDEDKFEALVDLLARRVSVRVQDEVITIKATWHQPATTHAIATSAVEAFLAERRRIDVQAIADTYEILQRSVESAGTEVEARLAEARDVERRAQFVRPLATPAPKARPLAIAMAAEVDPELPALRAAAAEARKTREDLERAHERQIAEFESRARAEQGRRTDRHPDAVAARLALERLRDEPEELGAARAAEARLVAAYAARGGRVEDLLTAEPAPSSPVVEYAAPDADAGEPETLVPALVVEEQTATYASDRLEASMARYQDLMARLTDVRLELEVSEAAFPYRYSVTAPARMPKKADSPNVALIIVGALMAGLGVGVTRAVFNELWSRSLLSPKALARHLGIGQEAESAS